MTVEKRISLVQMDVHTGDVSYNFNHMRTLLERAATDHPDIIVLPETWNTGFYPSPHLTAISDTDGAETQALLQQIAQQYEVHIVGGSVAIVEDGVVRNRSYVYDRRGELVATYTKMHGFSPAKEHRYFVPGDEVIHFNLDGMPCSIVTCYDIRFPELVRMAALPHTELIFVPAQWPTLRLNHWQILLAARAIENQCYVCAVNGCGTVGKVQSAGHSGIYNPWGDAILELGSEETIQTGVIDTSVIHDIRRQMDIRHDRRPSRYTIVE